MTLTTHAIVGSAAAAIFPNAPVTAFCVAFGSHFVLDAIPHWDYPIRSEAVNPDIGSALKFNRSLLADAVSIGSDVVIGLALALAVFFGFAPLWLVLLCALAGILPDALQFVYTRWKREPLTSLQRFHQWIHTDVRFKKNPAVGIVTQILFVLIFIGVMKWLL